MRIHDILSPNCAIELFSSMKFPTDYFNKNWQRGQGFPSEKNALKMLFREGISEINSNVLQSFKFLSSLFYKVIAFSSSVACYFMNVKSYTKKGEA